MPVYDVYSKRKKREKSEVPDVFQYEVIPRGFRNQIANSLENLYGRRGDDSLYIIG